MLVDCKVRDTRYVGVGGPGAVCLWCFADSLTCEEAGRGLECFSRYILQEKSQEPRRVTFVTSPNRFLFVFPNITASRTFGMMFEEIFSRKISTQTLYSVYSTDISSKSEACYLLRFSLPSRTIRENISTAGSLSRTQNITV